MENTVEIKSTRWDERNVVIVGAGRQGQAAARFLISRHANVTITDQASTEKCAAAIEALRGLPVCWVTGGHPLSLLDGADFICVSGGADLRQPFLTEAVNRGIPLLNDTEIFFQESPAPIIGLTGSAGKTTTTTLVGRIAESDRQRRHSRTSVFVGGNIGTPLIARIDEIGPDDCVILELSSFQLELVTISPHIAAVLNITPNHLDRHGTMEEYIRAKRNILNFQSESDWAVLSRDDMNSAALRTAVRGKSATFGFEPPFGNETIAVGIDDSFVFATINGKRKNLLKRIEISLPGRHNLSNVMAAAAIALSAGFDPLSIQGGIRGFSGVPHRLETVGKLHGVRYINDSIATAPERTLAALNAFSDPMILLLGGRDKKLPWGKLADELNRRAKAAVCFGEAGPMIAQALESSPARNPRFVVRRAATMLDALEIAKELGEAGDLVLLSPGGTSYDAYKDFEERGNEFRAWVRSQISNS